MKLIQCPTKLLHPQAKVPTRSSVWAAGHDICCVGGLEGLEKPEDWSAAQLRVWELFAENGCVVLMPGDGMIFRTGFAQAIREDYACFLWDRSGMGAKKCVGRLAGVIDPDYRGEWFVRLINHSRDAVSVKIGDKIVQGVYQERIAADCPIVDSLPETIRGLGGFGSTDKPQV